MADTLCGPSNALASLSKHAAADRSLQQDRLVARHDAAPQGFRSVGAARDAEFEAFQRGEGMGMGMNMNMNMNMQMPMARDMGMMGMPMQAQAQAQAQAPDWAADFQRLSLAGQQKSAPPAWHLDFARQQQQQQQQQQPALAQQHGFAAMGGYGQGMGMGMGGFAGPAYAQTQMHQQQQQHQHQQHQTPQFDEAAFEAAFDQAQRDATDSAAAQLAAEQSALSAQAAGMDRPGEMDPLLLRVRETRPAVYSAIQVWSETGLGRADEAAAILDRMLALETTGDLVTDAHEARWIVDSLRRIATADAARAIATRADQLIAAINQRLMSQYPLGSLQPAPQETLWRELETAGYARPPVLDDTTQQDQQQQPDPDADEMAATAGRLLERVADNTSEKFQNSQFLALMRRLRDREVRVEGDKMVETQSQSQAQSQQPQGQSSQGFSQTQTQSQSQSQSQPHSTHSTHSSSTIPPIDPHILSHAATDFNTPTYLDDDAAR